MARGNNKSIDSFRSQLERLLFRHRGTDPDTLISCLLGTLIITAKNADYNIEDVQGLIEDLYEELEDNEIEVKSVEVWDLN